MCEELSTPTSTGKSKRIGQNGTMTKTQEMSTDTEAAQTVNHLHVGDPVTSASLQAAVCETLVLASAPQPEEQGILL